MIAWRFYVYDVLNEGGDVIYVGKGSGNRANVSMRERGGVSVSLNAYFKREKDAYAYEVDRIRELSPLLNRHAGGNGSKVKLSRVRKQPWEVEIERVGSRIYSARLLLAFRNGINGLSSKVDIDWPAIEAIAHGSRA